MKTTNYEISRQLAEAGFKGEHDFSWYKNESGKKLLNYSRCGTVTFQNSEERILDYYEYCFPAYDLETILEVLPKQHDFFSRGIGKYELRIWYHENKMFIGYQNFDGFDKLLTFEQEENESLADTAARLLLSLHEKNLIKF